MPLDGKAVSGQDLCQSIGGCARAASGAGHFDQSYSSVYQPMAVNGSSNLVKQRVIHL